MSMCVCAVSVCVCVCTGSGEVAWGETKIDAGIRRKRVLDPNL